jgi:mono/diheme cytochrome c family protein
MQNNKSTGPVFATVFTIIILSTTAMIAAAPVSAATRSEDTNSTSAASAGQSTYSRRCIYCHSRWGPNLLKSNISESTFRTVVLQGRKNTMMPPFETKLSPAEIDALWGYIDQNRNSGSQILGK